ncbi:hypothetical protein M9Y10_021746 [Tritrichomonas musculus]|uniref:USP domain-containing protein n=1 Tax=Tritrichomonas musculus TaxID=1915356 RepID=A0ABR2KQI7_9EUKA
MEIPSTSIVSKEASEKQNFNDKSTQDTEIIQNNINSSESNQNMQINIQLPSLNDGLPQIQSQNSITEQIRSKPLTPTVVVELIEDDNDKISNDQNNYSNNLNSNDNYSNIYNSSIPEQNPMNNFLFSNLNQGQSFTENQNSFDNTEPYHQTFQPNQNERNDYSATQKENREVNFLSLKTIPELRRSGLSDSNLLESHTPSNVSTEENSPQTTPFCPDVSTPPASPPGIENFENNEPQFKTLSINGNDKEKTSPFNSTDDEIYKDSDDEKENQKTNYSISSISFKRPSIMHNFPTYRYRPTNENEYTGLQNQGATCYMNSMLQALYHLPIFRRFIYQMDYSEAASDNENIPLNLQRLFAMMQLRIQPAVPTKELTNSFGWSTQDTYMQHDVQEFCRVILDNLETKMKKQENLKNAIPYLFRGTMKSEIRLKTNDFEKSNTESFYDLSMIVKDTNSLEESFKKYIEPETISDYDTEKNGKQEITKSVEFVQFPHVLYLHLRRFEYDPDTQNMKKINSRFEFPETIDLSQFMSKDADPDECQIFDLFGVLVHSGGSYSGHYFAFLRPSGNEDRWYSFNDSTVNEVTKEEAIEANYGGFSSFNSMSSLNNYSFEKSFSAYMLIYIRRSCIDKFYEEVSDSEIPKSAFEYANQKKYDIEQQKKEQSIKENTLSLKLFRNEDVRKNILKLNFSFKLNKKDLLSVKVMKDDLPYVLYQKVDKLLELRKFIIYKVDSMEPIDEINKNANCSLQSFYCKFIYIYSNFKENRVIKHNKVRNHHHHNQNHSSAENSNNENEINNDEENDIGDGNNNQNIIYNTNIDNSTINNEENQNEYQNHNYYEHQDQNNVYIINNNIQNNYQNENDANNYENESESNNNIYGDEKENLNNNTNSVTVEDGKEDEDDENDVNEFDNNANYKYGSGDEYSEEEEEEEEEEKNEEEEEEYETRIYDKNKIILVFYLLYSKRSHKYPVRFWRADRVKSHWRARRICNKCRRVLKVQPTCLYEVTNSRCSIIEEDKRLDELGNGAIIVIETNNAIPASIQRKDSQIIQNIENEEEEEEEENQFNYLERYLPDSFRDFFSYYQKQIDMKIKLDESEYYIKIPAKITNNRFIKFVKRLFKIKNSPLIVFYRKQSRRPLKITHNNETLESSLLVNRYSYPNDNNLCVYKFPPTMSYEAFTSLDRYCYYNSDGYIRNRTAKYVFMSENATVNDLINYKRSSSQKRTDYRVTTFYRNKITLEEEHTLVSDLNGRIVIEEIPNETGDFNIQLIIEKEAASTLRIFKNYKNKYIRKSEQPYQIECLFPIFEGEMFPNVKRRIMDAFYCDESEIYDISFYLETSDYTNNLHEMQDDDTISELIDFKDEEEGSFNILYVRLNNNNNNDDNQHQNNNLFTSSMSSHRNRDSINIKN